MNYRFEDFIGIFDGVYPNNFCKHLIDEFEHHKSNGAGVNRLQFENTTKNMKDDYQIFANGKNMDFTAFEEKNTYEMFFHGLQHCFDEYVKYYGILSNMDITCNNMKLQKTSRGGGYYLWHCEQGNGSMNNRSLVYMLYLNTLTDEQNGETEFLHQEKRIQPKENTMLIWPAGFTHTHRGNAVFGEVDKYVVTGWFKNE